MSDDQSKIFLQKIAAVLPGQLYSLVQREDGSFFFRYLSPGLEDILEISVEEAIEDPDLIFSQQHPEDVPGYVAAVAKSRQTLEPFQHEWRIITPSGKLKWLRGSSRPERLPNQDTVWYGIIIDITEQKQSELNLVELNSTLRESEERFRLAFADANVGMCLVDLQGNLLQVNEKMSEIFGYSQQELEGITVNDLALPEDQGVSPQFMQKAIAKHQDRAILEKHYRHRQGHIIYGEVSSSLVRDNHGNPLYFISHVKDITQQKQYEQQLRESRDEIAKINAELEERVAQRTTELRQRERLLRRYFDQSLIGMAMTSPNKGWLNVNDKLSEMLGYSFAELQTMTWAEITYPDDLAFDLAHFNRVIRGEIEGYEIDKRFIHKNGQIVYTNLAVQVQRKADGSIDFFVVMLQDIGDRKEAEEQMRLALLREQELNELRAQFISAISHQFRTPLTVISSSASMLEKFSERMPLQKRQQHFQSIERGVKNIVQLIEDIITINLDDKIETKIQPVLGDLIAFCEDLNQKLYYLYPDSQINFSYDLNCPDLSQGYFVKFDRSLLTTILTHLLTNAIKYSPRNSVVTLFLSQSPEYLIFTISDSGIGILEEEQEQIFEPFQRGSNVGHVAGIGLGLSIVKRFVESYPGKMTIQSTVGQGTIFSVFLSKL